MAHRIIVIGGGTGSGKSALATALCAALAPALRVTEDDYYHCASRFTDFDASLHNFDEPSAKDLALLAAHLAALRAGQIVSAPRYDFATHMRMAQPQLLEPAATIVVEGLHALGHADIRASADLCVFVDTSEEVRLARRLVRDVRERGRDIEGIFAQFLSQVRPMHARHVAPTRAAADLIVNAETAPPETLAARIVAELAARR